MVHVRISSYGRTRKVWIAREKRNEKHEAKPSASLASRVLSKLSKCVHNSIYAQLNVDHFFYNMAPEFTALFYSAKTLAEKFIRKRARPLLSTVDSDAITVRRLRYGCTLAP